MDTLIETVRIRNGAAPLWYLHVRRLATSCRALGVPIPTELTDARGRADRVHRLLVSRRGLGGGRAAGGEHGAGAARHLQGGAPAVSS